MDSAFDDIVIPTVAECDARQFGEPMGKISASAVKSPANKTATSNKMKVAITRGLKSSHKKFELVAEDMIESYLSANRDCYEITLPIMDGKSTVRDGTNRVFVDIDGKQPATPVDNDDIVVALKFALADWSPSIMTASKGDKLSFRITLPTHHGSREAIRVFVKKVLEPVIVPALEAIAEGAMAIDYSVYSSNRKMRMWNSSKDGEVRPYRLAGEECGTVADTLITVIPPTAEALPEPVAAEPVAETASTASTASDPAPAVEPAAAAADGTLLEKVIMGLGACRYNTYEHFIRVGFICFNEGLPLAVWERFAAQSPKNKAGDCGKHWTGFRKSNLTQATLWKWLKEDNPTLHAELMAQRTDVWKLLGCLTHADTAQFFYSIKPDAYAYHEELRWFQIQPNNIWKNYEKTPNGLMTDIWMTLKKFLAELTVLVDYADQSETAKARRKLLEGFGKSIGNKTFVEGVIAFLPALYNISDLDKRIDQTRNVFAFADGWCYDCDTDTFRTITPTDWVSTTAGYAMPKASNPAIRAELRRVLFSIFENDAVSNYMLRITATCLNGTRRNEEFYLLEGKGRNGKGVLGDLTKAAFGDYFGSWAPEVLTKPTERKDAPQSEIARARPKRFILTTEPAPDDKIQTAIVKRLTGGDTISVRDLYRGKIEFRPQFGIFVQTNHLPKQDQPCDAFKLRARRIVFPFVFVDEPTEPWHRQADKELKPRLESAAYRDEFVLMLVDAYRSIDKTNWRLDAPEAVRRATSEWINGNNPLFDWLPTRFTVGGAADNKDNWVAARDLLEEFRADTGTNDREMTAEKFKGFMKALGVEHTRRGHPFKRSDGTECGAGSYYVGLARVAAEA